MPSTIFAGSKVKTLKDTLTLNGKSDIISSMVDPTASAVDAPIGSLLINQTSGKLYRKLDAGSSVNWEEVGSGTGGINYILNPSAEVNTTGWSTYADAAGTAPVDGSGGSPNVTWTRSTTSPLRGVADFNFAKDAANRQGQGVSVDFTIDEADKAKVLSVTFDYEVLSGTYADADLTVYLIADPTGTPVVIQPAGYTVQAATVGTTMRQIATFQTQATGLSYRLCFHVASTSASAYTLAVDNVVVGPQSTVQGAAISDWVSYTPVMSGGTASTISGRWSRVGDSVHVRAFAILSAGGVYNISLPFAVDATKFPNNTSNAYYGMASYSDISANVSYTGMPYFPTSTTVRFYGPNTTEWSSTTPVAFQAGDVITIDVFYPVQGWSSNTVLSQDTDTRVVAASFSVTGSHTSSGSFQAIPSLTVRGDTHGMISGTTVTIPVSGWYDFSGNIGFLGNSTGIRDVQIAFNPLPSGVPFSPTTQFSSPQVALSGGQTHVGVGGAVYLNAGTQITFLAYQNSGGSLAYGDTLLTVKRLSGPATIAASESVQANFTNSAGSSIAGGGAYSTVVFSNKVIDTHNAMNTSTGVYTIPVSGVYQITGLIRFANNLSWSSSGYANVTIYKNSSTVVSSSDTTFWSSITPVSVGPSVSYSDFIRLNAGDTLELKVAHGETTARALVPSSGLNRFTISKIGN